MQELDPARPHLANRLLKQPSSEGGCCAASLPAPAASASDATVRYRRACAAPPPQQPDRACAPSQPLCAVRMLSFALGGMELSRERCGKQCTKWRRQAWWRRRQGERGGRGRRVWTAAVLMLPPRRFCARAGGSAVLCCQALGGAERGGQHPGLRHPVAVPGARSLAPPRLWVCLVWAAATRGPPRSPAGCRSLSASPGRGGAAPHGARLLSPGLSSLPGSANDPR